MSETETRTWDQLTDANLTELDGAALHRALAACHFESPARSMQLVAKLQDGESWTEVAIFGSICVQSEKLKCMPWQWPCCVMVDLDGALREPYGEPHARREVGEILKRLLDAGLSRFEPDPMGAIAKAEQRRAAK